MKILVINAGSSSLKFQLFDMDTEQVLVSGLCERIGLDGHLKFEPRIGGKPEFDEDITLKTHKDAIAAVLDMLMSEKYGVIKSAAEIDAVGHRVVHGAEEFSGSALITDDVMAALERCIPLAPLHNPANIDGIKACREITGENVPQVGVFDTAFHQTMPRKAFAFAIPNRYYDEYKIRRYGFHGTSHFYVSRRAAEMLGKPVEELKLITCHMGNGSSVCAVEYGKSTDTTMGFTPLDGLPMGTRCGSLDCGVPDFIMKTDGIDMEEMMRILNKESGVLGISGLSSDFRDLVNAAAEGHVRAGLAVDVFCYSAAKAIGALTAAMNGVDAVIFTAGIGENSAPVRAGISKYLSYLGCELDAEANKKRGEMIISTPDSRVKLMVVPTNEELVIARDTKRIVEGLAN